jgi:capsule biosynthesis phosphatase
MDKMTFIYDLDKTLCTKKQPGETYADVKPIQPMIDQLNKLYDEGHEIIIMTARNMVTQSNHVSKVVENVGRVTLEWLDKHGVKYNGLHFGKDYGRLYIDDKACLNDTKEIKQRIEAIKNNNEEEYINKRLKMSKTIKQQEEKIKKLEKELKQLRGDLNE